MAATLLRQHVTSTDQHEEHTDYFEDPDLSFQSSSAINLSVLQDLDLQIVEDYTPKDNVDNQSLVNFAENVRVPSYLLQHAKMLKREKEMTIDQISKQLRDDNHSESVISMIARQLEEDAQSKQE